MFFKNVNTLVAEKVSQPRGEERARQGQEKVGRGWQPRVGRGPSQPAAEAPTLWCPRPLRLRRRLPLRRAGICTRNPHVSQRLSTCRSPTDTGKNEA